MHARSRTSTQLSNNLDFSSDSTKVENETINHDFSALVATQKQLQDDLRALSTDVNRKFETIMSILQQGSAGTSGPTNTFAGSSTTAPSVCVLEPPKGAVRLAPLPQIRSSSIGGATGRRDGRPTEIHFEIPAGDSELEEKEQDDCFPTDSTADLPITSMRTSSTSSMGGTGSSVGGGGFGLTTTTTTPNNGGSTGGGLVNVFTFHRNRSRSRSSSSIGIDTALSGALEPALNGVNYNLKSKPSVHVGKK